MVGRRRDQRRIAALLPVGGARYTPVLSALRPRSRLALLAADAASQLNEALLPTIRQGCPRRAGVKRRAKDLRSLRTLGLALNVYLSFDHMFC